MARGRDICNTLKAIRKQIADANGIAYSPEECHFTGECKGTCPKCEQDVRDLEYELRRRQIAGKAIKVVGIAAGLVALTACSDGNHSEMLQTWLQVKLSLLKRRTEPKKQTIRRSHFSWQQGETSGRRKQKGRGGFIQSILRNKRDKKNIKGNSSKIKPGMLSPGLPLV